MTQLLTFSLIALLGSGGPIQPRAQVPSDSLPLEPALQFECAQYDAGLATVVHTVAGDTTPIILWNSPDIDTSKRSPQELCEQSAQQFQTYANQGQLTYLTTGRVNRQPVVCIASELSGGCVDVLVPLRVGEAGVPEDRPPLQLTRILRIRTPVERLIEETGCRIYVEFARYLSGEDQGQLCPDLNTL